MALIDITPVMTSNTTPAPYVVSASSSYGVSNEAWKAFDSLNNTSFVSKYGDTACWLKIDMGQITKLDAFAISSQVSSVEEHHTRNMKNAIIYGSNDDAKYNQIIEISNQILWDSDESRLYRLNETVKYRYYKLVISDNNGFLYTGVSELRLFKDDGIQPEPISNKKASLNYCLPRNSTLAMNQRQNDPREGLLGFASDPDNRYGTLYMIDDRGKAIIPKAGMAEPDLLFDGFADAITTYNIDGTFSKYKYLLIYLKTNITSVAMTIPVKDFLLTTNLSLITLSIPSSPRANGYLNIYYTSDTSFTIRTLLKDEYISMGVSKIYGIK